MSSSVVTVLSSIIIFLLVIVVHELGHFFAAKAVGIKVNEFSIGMGPTVYKKLGKETKYSLRALPIGGYVAMEGEEENSNDPRSFNNAKPLSRFFVIISGVIMNFILAFLVIVVITLMSGVATNTIGSVVPDSPAEQAGLLEGDVIIRINNQNVENFRGVVNHINESPNTVQMEIERDGTNFELSVEKDEKGLIGITGKPEYSLLGSLAESVHSFIFLFSQMFGFLGSLFSGKVRFNDVGGPVVVIQLINSAAKSGLINLLYIFAFINVNIGFFNMLPIPALDGSKALLIAIEAIRGKRIPEEKETLINTIGFVLLFSLLIAVTFKDIHNLFR